MKKNSSVFYFEEERKNKLMQFLRNLSIDFNNLELLNMAFCHSSYSNELEEKLESNERLEFLGDSVLNLVITDYLYTLYPDKNEGDLSKARSYIVSEESLSSVAKELSLGEYILLGKGEESNAGREKKGILADALEAFIGAYYLDKGFQAVKKIVTDVFDIYINLMFNRGDFKDYKSLLQEYVQKKYKISPRYALDREEGPDHDKIFYVNLYVNQNFVSNGSGRSKKEAEMKAAEIAYKTIQNIKI